MTRTTPLYDFARLQRHLSVDSPLGARRFDHCTMKIVGLKSECSCHFERQAVEPHPCDCSTWFGRIKQLDVLGKLWATRRRTVPPVRTSVGLSPRAKLGIVWTRRDFRRHSVLIRWVSWHQKVAARRSGLPAPKRRTAIASDTTMSATAV